MLELVFPKDIETKELNNVTFVGVENNVTVVFVVSILFNLIVPFITTLPELLPKYKFDVQFEPIVKVVGVDNNEKLLLLLSKLLPKNEIELLA